MILEARSRNCFSAQYALFGDGQPIGSYRTRRFSGSIEITFTGRRRRRLQREGFFGSSFTLRDDDNRVVASARRSGMLATAWELSLSAGTAQFVSAGRRNTRFVLTRGERPLGEVDRMGRLSGSWRAEGEPALGRDDLLLAGLLYQSIRRRRASAPAASP